MKETIKDEVVEFEEHGVDIARIDSSSASRTCTISISTSSNVHFKKELEINQPLTFYIPNYGLKEIKLIRIDTYDIDVRIRDVPISANVAFIKDMDNSNFSDQEKLLIIEQLKHLEEEVKNNAELTEELKQDFSENIAYVRSSLDRMGRKDWLILSMGLLGNFASGALYAPDAAIEMASTISNILPQFLNSITHAFPAINNIGRLGNDS